MKKLMLALASLAALTGSAVAADMAVKAPPPVAPAPVYNWTGFWVSAGFGYALADIEERVTSPVAPFGVFDTGHDVGAKGWLGKVGAGWDYQFAGPLGNWLIGVFADGQWSNIKGNDSFLCVGCGSFSFAGQQQNDWSWAVGARLGYVVTPTLLTYFNGGWTQAQIESPGVVRGFFVARDNAEKTLSPKGGCGRSSSVALPARRYLILAKHSFSRSRSELTWVSMASCNASVPLLDNSAEAFLSRFCFQSRIACLVALWASAAALWYAVMQASTVEQVWHS